MMPAHSAGREISFLLIGPVFRQRLRDIGGTAISFDRFCNFMRTSKFPCSIVATNHFRKVRLDVLNFVATLAHVVMNLPRIDIIVAHFSPGGAMFLGPFVYLLARLTGKRIAFRIFGGNLNEYHRKLPDWKRYFLERFACRTDLLLLQTRELVNYFSPLAHKVSFLPTCRPRHQGTAPRSIYSKRLVYIGQIIQAKGIDLVLELRSMLPSEYQLDLYGPILEKRYEGLRQEVFYKGMLTPETVRDVLCNYDVLLFPTAHPGEGYPGIVLEALLQGIPVVASRWGSLGEIIHHNDNGMLIESRDPSVWLHEILRMDPERYQQMSLSAWQSAAPFDQELVYEDLLRQLLSLKDPASQCITSGKLNH
ncbi:MAG: glycosyltransferase family 4 protein [Saprospiraceae bacterium]|nr:glycosyltransferase family 4 protein [Saprospiraceae bacterium]